MASAKAAFLLVAMALAAGCRAVYSPAPLPATMPAGLLAPERVESVAAMCAAPAGWVATPLQTIDGNNHQMWLSPSGRTAYGVIHIDLPWPVGHDLILWVLIQHIKHEQGWATLLSKQWDAELVGLRFLAEDPRYRMRGILLVRGWEAWVVYAGTNRNQTVEEDELKLAEGAREMTRVGGR